MTDKRLDIVSSKIETELHEEIIQLANMDDHTVSSLIRHLLIQYRDQNYTAYKIYSRVFAKGQDLPGKPDQ